MGAMPERFAFGVLPASEREFFGNADGRALYEAAIERLTALGGTAVEIDLRAVSRGQRAALSRRRGSPSATARSTTRSARGHEMLHPVLRRIIDGGAAHFGGGGVRRAAPPRRHCARRPRRSGATIDLLLLPTTGTTYRIAEIEADPIELNDNLGRYTNFCNLLDLSAIAVPAGFRGDGLPFGVTLFAPAFHDPLLAAIGGALHQAAGLPLGATGHAPCRTPAPPRAGGASRMLPSRWSARISRASRSTTSSLALGARLRRATRTAAEYRLYALPDGKRPGLVRRPGAGVAIEVEVWDVPSAAVGGFVAGIAGAARARHGSRLEDGSEVTGFLCEAHAVESARDISEFGGWRGWLAARGAR